MATCAHCKYSGRPRLRPAWLLWLAGLVWLVPLAFLAHGYWPFFLLPAVAISAWAVTAVRRACPHCGHAWPARRAVKRPAARGRHP